MLVGFVFLIFNSDRLDEGLNYISEACLFFGSDNAFEDDYLWMMGCAITFVEMVVFQIVLFTIDASNNPLLQAMRESGTARTLSIIIWVCFLVKHYTHYYIGCKMFDASIIDEQGKSVYGQEIPCFHCEFWINLFFIEDEKNEKISCLNSSN